MVSGYLQLRKVGRRWVGLCPFHGEKTPSFSVNAEQGLFYCFGCQRSGDAITFVRDIEQVDFVGAVEHLARRAGISLRYTASGEGERRAAPQPADRDPGPRPSSGTTSACSAAPDAAPARRYLRSRGFDGERVRRFRLGWAPDGWDEAVRALGLERRAGGADGPGPGQPGGPPAGLLPGPGPVPDLRRPGRPGGLRRAAASTAATAPST